MKKQGLGEPQPYYCKADNYMSRSRADHKHNRFKLIGPFQNKHDEVTYAIQDRIIDGFVGGEYQDYDKCKEDCKLLNDMDVLITHFKMLTYEDVFVCDTSKLFQSEIEYDFKRYTFKELLEEQYDKIQDQQFRIHWLEKEVDNLETYNDQLEAENEGLELLLEHKLNDLSSKRYEYVEGNDIYIHDTLTGQRFYQSDLDSLTLLLNNYSLAMRRIMTTGRKV